MIRFAPRRWPVSRFPRGRFPDNASRYQVLRRVQPDADELVAIVPPGTLAATLTGADLSDELYYVRAVNRCGLADRDPVEPDLRRVAFDAAGTLILPAPSPVTDLSLVAAADGEVLARWTHRSRRDAPPAATFNVYAATGGSALDFDSPTLAGLRPAGRPLTASLGPYPHGTAVRAVVRAVSESGVEEANTRESAAVADAQAPDRFAALALEIVPA